MPGPQKENGYTPVANEILEAVAQLQINGTQFRILMVVWRYTYGFNRKQHTLSENFIANATSIHKKQVGRELLGLIKRQILIQIKEPSFSSPRVIGFNKYYKHWQSAKTLTVSGTVDQPGIGSVDPPGIGSVDQDIQKEKQIIKQKDIDAFFETAWKLYPRKEGKGKLKNKTKRTLYELGIDTVMKCIERYKNSKEDWREWQHGSTFFNSGYIDYLDENYEEKGGLRGGQIFTGSQKQPGKYEQLYN